MRNLQDKWLLGPLLQQKDRCSHLPLQLQNANIDSTGQFAPLTIIDSILN
jgi:hypothetical protein